MSGYLLRTSRTWRALIVMVGLTRTAWSGDLTGWQGMRVVEQSGHPTILKHADIDADGRDELIAVNAQFSRLDIYRWLPPDDRKPGEKKWKEGVNDLPMAPDLQRDELQLEHVPHDVIVRPRAGQPPELLILVAPPNRVLSYTWQDHAWKAGPKYLLPPGEFAPRHKPLLLRETAGVTPSLLIGFESGIHILELDAAAKSDWLSPREGRDRLDWWLADMDGDGDQDLLELGREADESLRWYETVGAGHLSSAAVLIDHAIGGASVLQRAKRAAQPLVIDGDSNGLLRRHELQRTEVHPVGDRHPLALAGGRKAIWCGVELDGHPALIAADRERPQLLVNLLESDGWQNEQSFPCVSDVLGLMAPLAQAGTVLIWAKDAPELLISRWEEGRLSYPRPWSADESKETRKVIGTGTYGEIVWWAQLLGKDLQLWTWSRHQSQPSMTLFTNVGTKLEQVVWLGGSRLLYRETHGNSVKVAENRDGKTVLSEPSHLKKSTLDQYRVFEQDGKLRPGRFVDGVLQWLDADLQAEDQIMLPQGQKLSDFVPQSQSQGEAQAQAWALQEDGKALHRLQIDANGVAEVREKIRIGGGVGIQHDPILGLLLLDARRIILLREGPLRDLQLVDVADNRIAQSAGLKDLRIHRIDTLDVNGDGNEEIVLFDDIRHQITIVHGSDDKLEADMAWPVFEDKKYPYDDESAPVVHEPRSVISLDLDGDQARDLAMLCHDRLLIYLAKDNTP